MFCNHHVSAFIFCKLYIQCIFTKTSYIQLKAKLGEKEKQLEKEISANNLLKQRLVS